MPIASQRDHQIPFFKQIDLSWTRDLLHAGKSQGTTQRTITGPGISDGGQLGLICIMVQTDTERK